MKSAILLAGLAAEGETVVREQVATRSHTEEMLTDAGADITVHRVGPGLVVRLRPSRLRPFHLEVPGDPSQAAFWVVAACVTPGSDVVVENVYVGPGRAGFIDVLARMGARVELENRRGQVADIRARHSQLVATTVAGAEIPSLVDEIPALAVAAAVAEGTTSFRDAGELRVKETDRVASITSELSSLGARVEALSDGLVIQGGRAPSGGAVHSYGDHRIAMAMAVAGLAGSGTTTIEGWEAVATSYPAFADHLAALQA